MLFNSYVFLLAFLPLSLAGFFALSRLSGRAGLVFLLLASLVFYGWWNPAYLLLLGASIAGNYACGRLIGAAEARPARQGLFLGLGIAANLALLIRYKYLADLLGTLHAAFGSVPTLPAIALPLGISFFTFTQIGWLIDRRAGLAPAEGPLAYLLFVTFFPHLIAGPILSNREMIPQFRNPAIARPDGQNLVAGAAIFTIGLLKKCALADPLGPAAGAGFAAPGGLSAFAAWHAVLAYSLQLYFDFSGYSDMAIGLARMFNLRFPQNFNAPYRAESVIDYWQRWHMTLTRWLTLYLFNPLAMAAARRRGARGQIPERPGATSLGGFTETLAMPLLVTMTLAGIWHGSGWQYLLFGLWHAALLTVNHAWRCFGPRRPSSRRPARLCRVALTYLGVLVGTVLFRAPSDGAAWAMLAAMAGRHGVRHVALPFIASDGHGLLVGASLVAAGHHAVAWLWLGGLYAIIFLAPTTQQIMGEAGKGAASRLRFRLSLPWALAGGVAAMAALLSVGGTSEFLYFQF
ncbi:MAG: MBOAT family protein [Rhodospirillales bacterium]|nr:MBOAT family protein [Rhodospirillales bacterium]